MAILSLHKSDETHIENLYDVLHLTRIKKYTGINELSFDIPSKVQDAKTEEYIDNPDIALIKYDYLIKHEDLWYIIKRINKKQEDGVEYCSILCYGRAYQIKQKRIREFKTGTPENPVKNLTNTANLVLSGTIYSLGDVDVSLDLKYRAIEIRSNALDGLNRLAETWDCAWLADDKNKKIHFVDYKIDGGFLGIYLTENNYLKNINLDMREDSIITRLHIYGKNDISVHAVNMGKDYIDDFSFYKNTDYMSQNLIDALNNYESAIAANTSQYSTYLTNKNVLQVTLFVKQNELAEIQNDINLLERTIDVKRANNENYSTEISQLTTKKTELTTKQTEINNINIQITSIDTNINSLVTTLNINNYLTIDQQNLLKNFIIEEDFNDTVITEQGDSFEVLQDLLNVGREYLSQNNTPRYSASVDIIALNKVINDENCKIDASKLILGSIVKVKVDKLNIDIDAKILEIEESFDDYGLNIKIANTLNISDGSYKIQEILQSINDSKNLVALNLDNWNQAKDANNTINQYLQNAIDTSVQNIKNADNNFQLNHRGLVLTSSLDNGKYQTIVNSEGIILSEDYGETWNVGINRGRVNAEVLAGQLVIASQGIFNGITCLKADGLSQTILNGNDGLKIQKKDGEKWVDQLYTDINGNIVLNGLSAVRQDQKAKTVLNATEGISIYSDIGEGLEKNFYVDLDGRIKARAIDIDADGTFGGTLTTEALEAVKANIDVVVSNTIITQNLYSSMGRIADLTVNELDTSFKKISNYLAGDTSPVYYKRDFEQYSLYIQADTDGTESVQYKAKDGRALYWTDNKHTEMTTEITAYPVMVYKYTEHTKMELSFRDVNGDIRPRIILGAGFGNETFPERGKFIIDKATDGGILSYTTADGTEYSIEIGENGIIQNGEEKLTALSFFTNGFSADYNSTTVSYRWTKDIDGRITQFEDLYTGETVPVTWGGGSL